MDVVDLSSDDRTFRDKLSDGDAADLKNLVDGKLKAVASDYYTEELADYVMILVKNGRSKREVMKLLDVIIGEETVSFVSWLWDQLLNVEHKISTHDNSTKSKSQMTKKVKEHSSQLQQSSSKKMKSDVEYEKKQLKPKSQMTKKVREHSSQLQQSSSKKMKSHVEYEKKQLKPKSQMTKKVREHSSQLQQSSSKKMKSDVEYEKQQLTIHRRQHIRKYCLQRGENEDYLEGITSQRAKLIGRSNHPLRVHHTHRWLDEAEPVKNNTRSSQSIAPTSRLLQFALRDLIMSQQRTTSRTESVLKPLHKEVKKDASEAVGSVFMVNWNHDTDTPEADDHPSIYEEDLFDEEELDDIFTIAKDINLNTLDNNGNEISSADGGQKVDVTSREQNTATKGDTSQKILNISLNVNTWKPPRVENSRNLVEIQGDARRAKRKVQLNNSVIIEDHLDASAEGTKRLKKTVPSSIGLRGGTCTSYDADARTIFISNVHFVTTKEILAHHFSEFGDIRKSVILSDATTGQPIGSAIVEFSEKESAEKALSLNGTYFMSRVIKVAKGKTPPHDDCKPIVRPRISRYSLSGPILRRVIPLSTGVSSTYLHHRFPHTLKPQSLQWSREQSIKSVQMASALKRNFTYVRKTD